MRVNIVRGKADKVVAQIAKALSAYLEQHPRAKIDLYRQNSVSVRVRIEDPDFAQLDKSQRHDRVWKILEHLPEDVQGDISMLVLVTPEEKKSSIANIEFDDPIPSRL